MFNKEEVLADPAGTFREPRFVLEEQELSAEMKLKILEAWKHTLLELQHASEENMTNPEGPSADTAEQLRKVTDTLRVLRKGGQSQPKGTDVKGP